jgi:hypothetical protein
MKTLSMAFLMLAAFAFTACAAPDLHSAKDYAAATSAGDPDGSLTLIGGPATPLVLMTSALHFPQGDTAQVRSVLMYDAPGTSPGMCRFEVGYKAVKSYTIVKEDAVQQPCDGKQTAHFHIAGLDVSFVAHLEQKNYKGTPVTLLEIGDHNVPSSLRVVY